MSSIDDLDVGNMGDLVVIKPARHFSGGNLLFRIGIAVLL